MFFFFGRMEGESVFKRIRFKGIDCRFVIWLELKFFIVLVKLKYTLEKLFIYFVINLVFFVK